MRSTRRFVLLLAALFPGACAAPRLAPPGAAVMAPEVTADAFVMPDGMRLPYRAWLPKCPPQTVVLALHGMNDSRDAWEIPAPSFAAAGIAVFAPDLRGFGATATRGLWPGTAGLLSDTRVMVTLLRARYPRARLYLMGESMGAAVLMVLAASPSPPAVDGYVLSAPAVWGRAEMNYFMRDALWLAWNTIPGYELVNRGYVKIIASDNRAALVRLSTDPLTLLGTRVDAVKGLVDLMDAALTAAPKFQGRALFLYGGKDQLVPKDATRTMWRALRDPEARLAYYPTHYHLSMRDLGRAEVIRDVVGWIKDPRAPLISGADRAAAEWLQIGP